VTLDQSNKEARRKHRELMIRYETGHLDEEGYLDEVPDCVPGATRQAVCLAFDAYLLGLYPGAAELIGDLRGAGIATGCLSNTNERHWRMMMGHPDYAALRDLAHRFASHDLGVMKPAEAAYRHVERATGFSGRQILFFDDKPENVEAARAVGWRAERIDHVDDPVMQMRGIFRRCGSL
jgi:putative hydrolase of the HAD superfamily